jgi:lipopolysaccharide biosynthesis protein
MSTSTPRIIAYYLPQFHPIPENDQWWGTGFTEWTNVGNAKPLFKGHYQPRVPADLGYYDLRLPESRIAQAKMAKEYGIEGFCYWHYWFGNGKQLLERPFNEVLKSGEPDFPFCLAWANHSWANKQFNKDGNDKLLIEQKYLGIEDYTLHFNTLLPAFLDKRYIRVDDKPLFSIYSPFDLPNISEFIELWQKLAKENGLKGIHFVAHTYKKEDIDNLIAKGFSGVNIVRLFNFFNKNYSFIDKVKMKLKKTILHKGLILDYAKYSPFFNEPEDSLIHCYPTIIPNWDHSPRSGRSGHIFINATPKAFKKHVINTLKLIKNKPLDHQIVFLKSWNEWAEGNYMEPDLKYGKGFLNALKEGLEETNT